MRRLLRCALLPLALAALTVAGCSRVPDEAGLRDSFAAQLASNRYIKDVQRNGDDVTFSGPGAEGEDVARWRVHIDSATVEESRDAKQPYRGVVKSSWFANDRRVLPRGADSNLPIALQSNGLAQECWALWDPETKRWGWE